MLISEPLDKRLLICLFKPTKAEDFWPKPRLFSVFYKLCVLNGFFKTVSNTFKIVL